MHVSHRPSNRTLRNLQDLRELRSVEISVRTDLDPRISALRDQRRQPADFQLQSDYYQQVRLPQFQQKTRLCLHEMRVLITLRHGLNANAVAAYFLRERCQVSCSRHDIQFLCRRHTGEGQPQSQDREEQSTLQNNCIHAIS